MRLTVVGSGDASNAGGRGHSCYWLDGATPDAGLMVDFGGTALMRLHQVGKRVDDLGALVFTHLHGDHIGGWPYFYVDSFNDPRRRPLTIVGPVGVQERLSAYVRVAYGSLADRESPFPIAFHELLPGDRVELPGCTVAGFAADHQGPPEQPLCVRVTAARGASVAFSGDTRLCDGLRRAAEGVDLLLAECTGLTAPHGKHSTWEEWQEELPRVGAKRVVLTHLGRDVRPRTDELLASAPPGAPLTFAEDGMVLDVSG